MGAFLQKTVADEFKSKVIAQILFKTDIFLLISKF